MCHPLLLEAAAGAVPADDAAVAGDLKLGSGAACCTWLAALQQQQQFEVIQGKQLHLSARPVLSQSLLLLIQLQNAVPLWQLLLELLLDVELMLMLSTH